MFLRHGHGFFLAGLLLMSATATACADEGMWVFNNLPLGSSRPGMVSSRRPGGPNICGRRRCDSTMAGRVVRLG